MDYKKISIILTFLIIIFAGLSGYFYYQTYIDNKTSEETSTNEKILLKQKISDIKIEEIKNGLKEVNLSDFEIYTIETDDKTNPIGWYGLGKQKIAGYSSSIDYTNKRINLYLYFDNKEKQKIEDLIIYGNMAYINSIMNIIEYKKDPGTDYKNAYEISILLIENNIANQNKLSLTKDNIK